MNIYVGNLPFGASEDELRQVFAAYGEVSFVSIIKDHATGQPRGFGFVEMPNSEAGQAAIAGLNGQPMKGRPLKVNEARPKGEGGGGGVPRPAGTGGYGGGDRGSGFGSGDRGGFGGDVRSSGFGDSDRGSNSDRDSSRASYERKSASNDRDRDRKGDRRR